MRLNGVEEPPLTPEAKAMLIYTPWLQAKAYRRSLNRELAQGFYEQDEDAAYILSLFDKAADD